MAGRATLNRARVVAAAIALADAEGLEAVSMRALAEQLGVVPMALYKHVADKEDLLNGMVNALIAEMPEAPALPPGKWQEALRQTLLGARAVITAHPWARRAIETRTVRTPTVLDHMERVTQIFLRAGFSADLAHHVMHLLGNRIWGFGPGDSQRDGRGPAAGQGRHPRPGRLPWHPGDRCGRPGPAARGNGLQRGLRVPVSTEHDHRRDRPTAPHPLDVDMKETRL